MKSIKVMLAGIILILASLFFMGICILNVKDPPEEITLFLFVSGLLVAAVGCFGIKLDD